MTRRRKIALLATWTAPSLVFLAITANVYCSFRIRVPERAGADARRDAVAMIRAAVDGQPIPAPSSALAARALDSRGPVVVSVFIDGKAAMRIQRDGATWGEAMTALAREIGAHPARNRFPADVLSRARIKIDVVVGRGPLTDGPWLFETFAVPGLSDAMALNPGLEGLGARVDGKDLILLPEDLVDEKLLAKKKPSQAIPEWAMGVDLERASAILARRASIDPKTWAMTTKHLFRVRTDSFVEQPRATRDRPPLALYRGVPPAPELTAAVLRSAAIEGGHFLVAHIGPNGRYVYEHNLSTGQATDPSRPGPYSIPRHAGTTYFLAELYRFTKEEFLREPIERAFGHLNELIVKSGCEGTLPNGAPFACVADQGQTRTDLGSSALAVVALVEYQRATGDPRYLDLSTRLSNWILWMQRPDGSFRHVYDIKNKLADDKTQLLYYSGEAALAMARMHVITGDAKYAESSGRALDWLVGWYDFFIGGFFYGEEHWTCIAAEAAFPAVKRDKHREFCDGYGAFLRAQQPGFGDHPDQDDLAGAYYMTPFVMPFNTPAGSRTEAMISAYLLGKHHGRPDPAIKEQILAALQYVIGQQIRPETDFNAAGNLRVIGGVPGSPIDRSVRIDFVQHVCSAMIRAVELVEE